MPHLLGANALSSPAMWAALCALACGLLLGAERRGWQKGIWIFKPLASTAFVATALAAGALESSYGLLVLTGLVLCWLGDVLLIPEDSAGSFLAGIGSFLLGHVAYAVAFATLGLDAAALAASAGVVAALGGWILRWLWPHLEGIFRTAVPAYVLVIGSMVATSVASVAAGASPAIAFGAILFAVSDVAVARSRFIEAGFANSCWGLPLYFGGQVVLAMTVAGAVG